MKLSARNQFAGKVVEITEGATNGIVKIEIAPEVVISASITNESIKELGLRWARLLTQSSRRLTLWLVLTTNPGR